MPIWHIIDPMQFPIQTAAALGSFVFLMITRRMGWVNVLILFLVGQITAYYFTVPIADWNGYTAKSYGWLGFLLGALGMLAWGAIIEFASSIQADPRGTLSWVWSLWKGNSTTDSNSHGTGHHRRHHDLRDDDGDG